MSETVSQFDISVDQVEAFEFRVKFDKEQHAPFNTDEPPPLGKGAFPDPARMLAAALGSCLSASLLFASRKPGLQLGNIHTEVKVDIVKNENRRLRIGKVSVVIDAGIQPQDLDKARAVAAVFEDFCTVTASVRQGIPIETTIKGLSIYNKNIMSIKRIAILTGGGDVPGLNSVIKGVVYRASEVGIEVTGLRRGWEALTHVNLDDEQSVKRYVLPLNRENTRTIDRTGGTFIHSSRTNPSKMKSVAPHLTITDFPSSQFTKGGSTSTVYDVSKQVLSNLSRLAIDYLVAIGGDDTLSYAATLDRLGVKIVAIPKTMDNDVRNTEYCIGFSTAISRAMDAIQRQRTTVGSHERIGVFRVFGRDAGYTSLYTAYVNSLRCAIPEYKFDLEKMVDLLVRDKQNNPSNYSLVVLSEGAEWAGYKVQEYGEADAFGHRKKINVGEAFSDELKRLSKEDTIVSDLTYDLRSGSPDFVDKLVATTFGNMAFDAIVEGKTGLMAAINNGCYAMVEIPDPKLGPRKVDVATMYNVERFRPNYAGKVGLPIFLTKA